MRQIFRREETVTKEFKETEPEPELPASVRRMELQKREIERLKKRIVALKATSDRRRKLVHFHKKAKGTVIRKVEPTSHKKITEKAKNFNIVNKTDQVRRLLTKEIPTKAVLIALLSGQVGMGKNRWEREKMAIYIIVSLYEKFNASDFEGWGVSRDYCTLLDWVKNGVLDKHKSGKYSYFTLSAHTQRKVQEVLAKFDTQWKKQMKVGRT